MVNHEVCFQRRSLRANGAMPLSFCVLLSLIACSCQSLGEIEIPGLAHEPAIVSDRDAGSEISAGEPVIRGELTPSVPIEPVACEAPPMPIVNISPWTPPGMAGPWPHDEYLEDGGDTQVQVNFGEGGELRGLEPEDTVAIYDTIDGETRFQPSNRICLYAPRFGAVRHVATVIENLQNDQLKATTLGVMPQLNQEDRLATTALQRIGPKGNIGTKQPSIGRTGEVVLPAESLQPIRGIEGGLAIYENLLLMSNGTLEDSEKARLIEAIDAAIVWTHDKAVQVILDGRAAVDVTGDRRAQATFRVDVPNNPCLRVIKIASKKQAKPGDIVDFTIRFDNLGDQTIKNVVLVDNLTTRLEYVPQTAQSSRRAEFSTIANEGDSLVLRWDFVDPLPPGEGGLVRFNCRVR
jgi:uncharacterized repeat protein (TIGR01451 family)